jgi:hypothetical protein
VSNEQELSHIARMIAALERMPEDEDHEGSHNPVMRPEYWRKRIDVLIASGGVTDPMLRHANALLERLDNMTETRRHHEPRD